MRVLIAPLNWGIGHATRIIPIIDSHINQDHDVYIASSGDALEFLRERYPFQPFIELPDYGIKYHKQWPVWLSICFQSLKIFKSIKLEHQAIQDVCIQKRFDLIISDNRYGIYHKDIRSQLICHQLNPISPLPIFQKFSEYIHRFLCRHFDEILIPDYEKNVERLSGKLSSIQLNWKPRLEFINPLSQLKLDPEHKPENERILVLLSGIEPYRTILENKLIDELKNAVNEVVVIGGKLKDKDIPTGNVKYYPFLNKKALEQEINKAKYIICRSGYSTIMDLHLLKNKSIILIPTPGQTEQEYLATHLSKMYFNIFKTSQETLRIIELIENISNNNKLTRF